MGSTSIKGSEPRAHHFTPQCWLGGFTDTGRKDGRLTVTDLKRQKQWTTTPPNAGHRRDFYRVADPKLDPVWFERTFSEVETIIGPVLRDLYEKPQEPGVEAMDALMYFAALQYIRVPAFRPVLLRVADSINRSMISGALKSPQSWAKALKKAGIPADSPGAGYDGMLAFERDVINTGQYTISAENDFFLVRGFRVAASAVYPALKNRYWQTLISPAAASLARIIRSRWMGRRADWSVSSPPISSFSLSTGFLHSTEPMRRCADASSTGASLRRTTASP